MVPDWIATERVRQELARMAPQTERGRADPVGDEDIAAAVVGFTRNDEQVVLEAGKGLLGDGS